MRREIMFAGSGGQGVITASIIYAEAAALHEGFHAVQSQAYGPEARGGTSNAHVIINEIEVGYPKVIQPQVLVCLTQEAVDRFGPRLRPGGILLTDRFHVRRLKQHDARTYNLPMFEAVKEQIKLPIVFNICMLGTLSGLVDFVRPESLRAVIQARVPARYLDQNLAAFDLGQTLALDARPWQASVTPGTSWGARGEVVPGANGHGTGDAPKPPARCEPV